MQSGRVAGWGVLPSSILDPKQAVQAGEGRGCLLEENGVQARKCGRLGS